MTKSMKVWVLVDEKGQFLDADVNEIEAFLDRGNAEYWRKARSSPNSSLRIKQARLTWDE